MARRKSTRGSKIQPAMQTLNFTVEVEAGSGTSYLDLSQVASLVNRRFYRQGINWAVAGFKILSNPGTTGSVLLSKLPNTWVMSNAWEKGFRTWQRMNNDAMSETESIRPKFLDFKIYADADHHTAGYASNLLPTSVLGTYAPGTWDSSKIVVPFGPASPGNTATFEIMAVGANFNGAGQPVVSLIEGYAASRGLPNVVDPNTPGDADDTDGSTPENWMSALFNEGTTQTSEVVDDMITENNRAPYPFEGDSVNIDTMYPGGANQGTGLQIHDLEFISGTTIGGTTRLKGGNFPCGLARFDFSIDSAETVFLTLQIDLVPGNHRGYLCEPMTEM